jgi:hypothetical protein
MAATLKLGDRKWATKEGSLLAYNDENNNYKPLPFDFTRASSATRVNKQGLIETVASGVPRIDFTDANGALKLEPQRTNSLLQSNQFDTTWTNTYTTEEGGYDGIYGSSNAWKLSETTANSVHILVQNTSSISNYTFSIYIKKGTKDKVLLFDGTNNLGVKFNLETQSFNSFYDASINYNIEILPDGWARYSIGSSNTSSSFRIYMLDDNYDLAFEGNPLNNIYIQHAQLEQGSYATSYIPTQGSAVTRIVDACSLTPISGIIGQTEGTMFLNADIQKFNDSSFYIGISNGLTLATAIYMLQPSIGTLQIQKRNAGVDTVLNITTGNWSAGFNKVAIVYTTTSLKVFINGVQKGSMSFSGLPPFTRFSLGSRPDTVGGLVPKTEYKQVKLYNTALTDSEAIALTT